ncbi:hypothetical protein PHLCEN_2v11170 [Hermanssonia centrifuga]|uniref:Uncharacterized protein n=1 Tax=Hermanssonia centrifuga TaxID=98765 RepID=A0A2R6NKP7_9APHY|nr:hypothetical protein PHLCEN_2v11170 [Hermanssonia centrifuga]
MPGLSLSSISAASPVPPRKRTMSFSTPQPTKSARTLQRTTSYLSLTDMQASYRHKAGTSASHMSELPYPRPPRPHKDQRERRKAQNRGCNDQITIHLQSSRSQPASKGTRFTITTFRTSSPLAPTRSILPARAAFPRSKPEPDLYKVAITTRMRMSPEGQKILHMGPRLAFSIHTATQELERIVASQPDLDFDINMTSGDSLSSSTWVVVPQDDWEMVDS